MLTRWQSMNGNCEYVLAPDVVVLHIDDGTLRLLDLAGDFCALPVLGAEMLLGVLEEGEAATVAAMAQQYDISPEQVQADLRALLQELQQKKLIHKGPARPRRASWWPALILVPCLRLIGWLPGKKIRAGALLILASLAFACFGWARTIAAWHHGIRAPGSRSPIPEDEAEVQALDQAVRHAATSLPFQIACKERALACWTLMRWHGLSATLVVGLELFPLAGHCWCEAGPWTLSDDREKCELYTPVLSYE